MTNAEIQRQYDEVIAPHYDLDPHAIFQSTTQRVISQLTSEMTRSTQPCPLNVLDVGIGTGSFCHCLRQSLSHAIRPFGLDISRQMLEVAAAKLPDLVAEVDDATRVGHHFRETQFDLICTHFVTGFVPLATLGPELLQKLRPGGLLSFAGGTSLGYPELNRLSGSPLIRALFGGRAVSLADVRTPTDERDVESNLWSCGFEVLQIETFVPRLHFGCFRDFMAFGWTGGWLTPFIEQLGLHKASRLTQALLDLLVFPVTDEHRIVIALAKRPDESDRTTTHDVRSVTSLASSMN